jgi:predicted transcriptional regulator
MSAAQEDSRRLKALWQRSDTNTYLGALPEAVEEAERALREVERAQRALDTAQRALHEAVELVDEIKPKAMRELDQLTSRITR